MLKERTLFVGQIIYYKIISDRRGDDTSLKETKITKIGRKYFEIEEKWVGKFFKDSLIHDAGQYSPGYEIYLSKEDYENEIEANKIYLQLKKVFSGYGKTTMELSKLKAILSIVNS